MRLKRACGWTAAVILPLAAMELIAVRLRPERPAAPLHMEAPRASARVGEALNIVRPNGPVNVNLAGVDELDMLPGVGPQIALRIIEERERNGAFSYPEDLLAIRGIGQKTLAGLLNQINLD